MIETSVIIPSRVTKKELREQQKEYPEDFTAKTVDDLFRNAADPEKLEVIVMLDDYWPYPPLNDHKNLVVVHKGKPIGMRDSLNRGVQIARGKYIMKTDDHCAFGKNFEAKLKKYHKEDNWITIPARYSLDPLKWERTRGPICYMYLTFPYDHHDLFGTGFHGTKWHGPKGLHGSYWHRERERKDVKIDDMMIFQGSCYFMTKKHWEFMEGLDEQNHYIMYDEAIELDFKTWLSGGRVIVNKATWYAHLHKGPTYKSDFHLSRRHKVMSEVYNVDYWMNNKWPKQTRPLSWLIEKFSPLDGWPEDWQDQNKYAPQWRHYGLYEQLWGKNDTP